MTESDKRNDADVIDPMLEQVPDWAEIVIVECPDCSVQIKTHDLGDRLDCPECDCWIARFENIVAGEIA